MVNLAINDYCDKKIKIIKGEIKIKEKKVVSSSATKSEEVHSSVCDVEMHQFPAMKEEISSGVNICPLFLFSSTVVIPE